MMLDKLCENASGAEMTGGSSAPHSRVEEFLGELLGVKKIAMRSGLPLPLLATRS
jgi:hypothetical protein